MADGSVRVERVPIPSVSDALEPAFFITPHAWRRYDQRVRAHMGRDVFARTAERALELGHRIEIEDDNDDERFCMMYRRFSFIYRVVDHETRLVTVLPKGVRPYTEVRDDD